MYGYAVHCSCMKISSIRHKGLRRFLEKNDAAGLPPERLERIRRVLTALMAAATVEQMNTMPGWKVHPLKGNRTGTYAIAVSGNWRLTFWLKDGEIFDLDLEDYH
jgi:proteic killer suppression protein